MKVDSLCWIFIATLGLLSGRCESSTDDVSVLIDISQSVAHPGDNVTLTCRITGVPADTKVQWLKSVTAGSPPEVIATGESVTSLYSSQERYELVVVQLGDVLLHILNIYQVTDQDSGSISCVVPNSETSAESVTLHVYHKPSHISFHSDAGMHGSELTLTENAPAHPTVRCQVFGILPVPHYVFRIGQRILMHRYVTNTTVNVRCPPSGLADPMIPRGSSALVVPSPAEDKPCLVHLDYDVVAVLSGYHVTHRDDGELMQCVVNLTQSGWKFGAASIRLNIRYSPKFNCSRSLHVELGSRNVTIECHVTYNPQLNAVSVRWRSGDTYVDNRLKPGNVIDGYAFTEEKLDDKQSIVRLVIDHVQHRHQMTTVHFDAGNEVGLSSHSVRLIQHYRPPPKLVATPSSPMHRVGHDKSPKALRSSSSSSLVASSSTSQILVTLYLVAYGINCIFFSHVHRVNLI